MIETENFERVASDIIDAVYSLEYNDREKNMIRNNILYNLYKLLESKETYDSNIKLLMQNGECKNKLGLHL